MAEPSEKQSICVSSPNGRRAHEVDAEGAIKALQALGYHIVTDADKRVLDAIRDAEIEVTGGRNRQRMQFMFELQEDRVCREELARRGEKP